MDYKLAVKNLIDSFSWSYTKEECTEMFRYKDEKWRDVLSKIQMFEDLMEAEIIPENMIEYLLSYIVENNSYIESFINECIAPYVQKEAIGLDAADEFYRSIEIYNRQISNVETGAMVVLLTPIYTAASLIQNAYFFVDYVVGNDKKLEEYTTDEIGIYDIYRYLIRLILNPLKEWINYHLLDINEPVPMLIVSSLGTLTADFMSKNSTEFLDKIAANIQTEIDRFSESSEINEEEELN